jgi:hypothetical protein
MWSKFDQKKSPGVIKGMVAPSSGKRGRGEKDRSNAPSKEQWSEIHFT